MFRRALPSDPLNQDSEGAWHSGGSHALQERQEQKQKIDAAIRAALTLGGLDYIVAYALDCTFHVAITYTGNPDVGALSPDHRDNPNVCGGVICGPFYHGSDKHEKLPICWNCWQLEHVKRHLCTCCSWDDGRLAKGFTYCLVDHCPALGRKTDGAAHWHKSYYARNEWWATRFLHQHGKKPPTLGEKLDWHQWYFRELDYNYIWKYRQAISHARFGILYNRTEPSRGYGQGESMYEIASRLED